MTVKQPFNPRYGATQPVTAGAASANVTIDAQCTSKQLRICNTGTGLAYIRVGAGAQVATAADYPVPPNNITIITKDQQHDSLAYISAAGTTLLITPGEGF
jgi:hypothetical protein